MLFFRRKPAATPQNPIKKFDDQLQAALSDVIGQGQDWIALHQIADSLEAAQRRVRGLLARRPL